MPRYLNLLRPFMPPHTYVAGLLITFSASAQTRFCTQGHLPVESQPSLGFERPEYLGMGDSVRVLGVGPIPINSRISAAMRRQFVWVSYPAYRGQPAGQGWVLRQSLVSTPDSLLLALPPVAGQTITTTKTVTTRRRVVRQAAPRRPKATP